MTSPTKNPKLSYFKKIKTGNAFLEGLNSSLGQSAGKLWRRRVTQEKWLI